MPSFIKRLKRKVNQAKDFLIELFLSRKLRRAEQIMLARAAMREKAWEKAISHWQAALRINKHSNDANAYRYLAKCYMRLRKPELVEHNMKLYLEWALDLNIEEIVQKIKRKLDSHTELISSNYQYIGGMGNYGFISHTYKDDKHASEYITKVSRNDSSSSCKEKLFYQELREQVPVLKKITPALVDLTVMPKKNICFLTLTKISREGPLEKDNLDSIIKLHKLLASVKYTEIKDFVNKDDMLQGFQLKSLNSPAGKRVRNTFASIHKETTNLEVIEWLFDVVKRQDDFTALSKLIKRLKHLVFELRLDEKLDPEIDYVLVHGDFGANNILVDKEGAAYLVDWGSYLAGPKSFDLASYFRKSKCPFDRVEKEFLARPERCDYLSGLEKILLIYALIVMRFIDDLTGQKMKGEVYQYVNQALNQIENLVNQIN